MGDVTDGGRVQFDFVGSLALARRLWAIGEELQTEDTGRETEFDTARAKWEGAYAGQFDGRRATERSSRAKVIVGLHEDAKAWARAWAQAMNQQNRNNRAAEVERVRDDRGFFERAYDSTFGKDDSDEQVPMPNPVPVPTAPGFEPTVCETTY